MVQDRSVISMKTVSKCVPILFVLIFCSYFRAEYTSIGSPAWCCQSHCPQGYPGSKDQQLEHTGAHTHTHSRVYQTRSRDGAAIKLQNTECCTDCDSALLYACCTDAASSCKTEEGGLLNWCHFTAEWEFDCPIFFKVLWCCFPFLNILIPFLMHFGKLVPVNTRWFCQYDNKLVATLLRNSNRVFQTWEQTLKIPIDSISIVSIEGMYVF